MRSLKRWIDGALEIYRRNGLKSLFKKSNLFLRRRAIEYGLNFVKPRDPDQLYQSDRTDNEERWDMISSHLGDKDKLALDIGCASGFFTAKLAEHGIKTIGIDQGPERIKTAKNIWGKNEKAKFHLSRLNPENISRLPKVDVILLLTVYHHWCKHFGRSEAKGMLQVLAGKTRKIFFEPPGKPAEEFFSYISSEKLSNINSISKYYSSLLEGIIGKNCEIKYLGLTEYKESSPRTDPLFLIDCRKDNQEF